jgi:hypothetical protein
MSRGKNLQEMEVGTKQSRTAVNANARAADPMKKLTTGIPDGQTAGWEDLGGPTPENYRPDDNSSALKDASSGLKQVKDVVNKGAKGADPMKGIKKSDAVKEEEELDNDEYIEEEEYTDEDELISEEEEEEEGKKKKSKKDKEEKDDEEGEDEDEMKEEFDIEEDVNALLHGEDLSEEFQEKARMIFESALRSKVNEIRESLEVQYEERLVEEVLEIKEELEERLDSYLEYVAEEWLTENTLAVEAGLKEELTESFLGGLKQLFEEHYVEIPEEKYDVFESMVEKLDDMETKLNEQIEKNISLNKRLTESVADRIFDEISEGLATTQKEKLASLAESVEFESETEYREKLETLKESYFPSRVVSPSATTETLSEGVDVAPEYHSDSMNAYLKTLSAVANR